MNFSSLLFRLGIIPIQLSNATSQKLSFTFIKIKKNWRSYSKTNDQQLKKTPCIHSYFQLPNVVWAQWLALSPAKPMIAVSTPARANFYSKNQNSLYIHFQASKKWWKQGVNHSLNVRADPVLWLVHWSEAITIIASVLMLAGIRLHGGTSIHHELASDSYNSTLY